MFVDFGTQTIDTGELLRLVVDRVQKVTGLGDRVFLSVWPDDWHLSESPRAIQFVAIRPNNFPVWQSVVSGGGFDYTGFNSGLTITSFVQNSSDPESWSGNALTEEAIGITQLVMKVAGAVQGWFPIVGTNADADQRTATPLREYMRIADSGFRYNTVKKGTNWWSKVSMDVEMKYSAKLTTPLDIS